MPVNTSLSPYFDDFNAQKNYLRLLFNPSRAVQARELTQAQTVLQNQVSSFADSVFSENSRVIGAEITVNAKKLTLQINPTNSLALTSDIAGFLGTQINLLSNPAGSFAQVTDVDVATNSIMVDMFGGRFTTNDVIYIHGDAVTYTIDAVHNSLVANINDGIIYTGGYFVTVAKSSLIVDSTATMDQKEFNVGFTVTENVITNNEDPTLNDNAVGSYNYNAPGSDRLHRLLTLMSYEITRDATGKETSVAPANFTNIMYIQNGVVKSDMLQVIKYSEILDLMAHRTYDESGNYTISDFNIATVNTLAGNPRTQFDVSIGAGEAYVNGYEIVNQNTSRVTVNKAQTSERNNNQPSLVSFGTAFDMVSNTVTGTFDLYNKETVNLYSHATTRNAATLIGVAKVVDISVNLNYVRVHLNDIIMDDAKQASTIQNIRSIVGVTSSSASQNVVVGNSALLTLSGKNDAITTILTNSAEDNIKSVLSNSIHYNVSRNFNGLIPTANVSTIIAPDVTTDFVSAVVVYNQSGVRLIETASAPNAGSFSVAITNVGNTTLSSMTLTTSGATSVNAVIRMNKKQGNARAKTLVKAWNPANIVAVNGKIMLGQSDILGVTSLINVTDANTAVTTYTLDNGQTDDAYNEGSISGLINGKSYSVTFDYFTHGAVGDFFTVDSYMSAGNIDAITGYTDLYSRILTYTTTDLTTYKLINCLDMRRSSLVPHAYDAVSQNTNITYDYDQYIPRYDLLYLDEAGQFGVITGIPSSDPKSPAEQHGTMTICTLVVTPYTHVPDDVRVIVADNRHFNMRDIGKLEGRIENLERYVSLNLLEQDTAKLRVVDAAGFDRYKNGLFTDPFVSHGNGDTTNPQYNCNMDFDKGMLVPNDNMLAHKLTAATMTAAQQLSANIKIVVDSVTPAKSADVLMLNYSEKAYIEQKLSSSVININPFSAQGWHGRISLNPSSDVWFDTNYLPSVNHLIGNWNGVGATSKSTVTQRKSWWVRNRLANGGWPAQMIARAKAGIPHNRPTGMANAAGWWTDFTGSWGWRERNVSKTTSTVTKYTVPVVATDIADNRIATRLLEWMRPIAIQYAIDDMRPNVILTATFDGIDVSASCSNLAVDVSGKCSGVFTVPAGGFHVGTKVIKFVDADNVTDAETSFYAMGRLNTRRKTITTIRSTTTSSVNRVQTVVRKTWADPVAQSFLVTNPSGIFTSSMDLFFSGKDATLPVTIELVEMSNGYPTQEVVPDSRVTLYPASVNTSTNGQSATNFVFEEPIYLQPNQEYAVVISTNSVNYTIWAAKQGEPSLTNAANQSMTNRSGAAVSKQPYLGVMFKSQNSSTWSADQTTDIKFTLNRADYTLNQGEYIFNAILTNTNITRFMANIHNLSVNHTNIELAYSIGGAPYKLLENTTNIHLPTVTLLDDVNNKLSVRARLNTVDSFVSPIIDLNRCVVETGLYQFNGNICSTYISKSVKLSNPATDFRVILDAIKSTGSDVNVYFSTQDSLVPRKVTNALNYDTAYTSLVGSPVRVYHRQATTGAVTDIGGFTPTKINAANSYVSNLNNVGIFDIVGNLSTYGVVDKVFFTKSVGVTNAIDWVAGSHTVGSYVFHVDTADGLLKLWTANNTTTAEPVNGAIDWSVIPSMSSTDAITNDIAQVWRPMKISDNIQQGFDASNDFYEYTYVPDSVVDTPFATFAIKIELVSIDHAQISSAAKLRAIAVT
ncbi:MAG: DUF4815 domain-containing protein [Ghiorsea sp.]